MMINSFFPCWAQVNLIFCSVLLLLPSAVESQTVHFIPSCIIWLWVWMRLKISSYCQWIQNDINNFFSLFPSCLLLSMKRLSVYTVWFAAEFKKWMSCTFHAGLSCRKSRGGSCMIKSEDTLIASEVEKKWEKLEIFKMCSLKVLNCLGNYET